MQHSPFDGCCGAIGASGVLHPSSQPRQASNWSQLAIHLLPQRLGATHHLPCTNQHCNPVAVGRCPVIIRWHTTDTRVPSCLDERIRIQAVCTLTCIVHTGRLNVSAQLVLNSHCQGTSSHHLQQRRRCTCAAPPHSFAFKTVVCVQSTPRLGLLCHCKLLADRTASHLQDTQPGQAKLVNDDVHIALMSRQHCTSDST